MIEKRLKIYYDGYCRLCSAAVDSIEGSPEAKKFESIDIYRELPPGISYSAADRDMHAVDANGTVFKGADAVARILEEYPRWRWIARLVRLPFLNKIAVLTYRLVADNRRRFF